MKSDKDRIVDAMSASISYASIARIKVNLTMEESVVLVADAAQSRGDSDAWIVLKNSDWERFCGKPEPFISAWCSTPSGDWHIEVIYNPP